MTNYRKAFFLALGANVVFAAILAGVWWNARRPSAANPLAAATSDGEPQAQGGQSDKGQASAAPGERKVLYWYDSMNPSMRSDKPGRAPDGMDLVPMYAETSQSMEGMPPGTVMISATKQQLVGVRTSVVMREPLSRTIRAVAQVQLDETKIAKIHVKTAGWVEQVSVDFIGKLVRKGEPLFSVYSPDLVATQQEYLIARRAQKDLGASSLPEVSQGAGALLASAGERLRRWDITEEQIKKLDESGEISRTITIFSPLDGFVMKREAFQRTYITPETELFEIADFSTVWVNAEIYEYEVQSVKVGQSARMTLSYFPGKSYFGKVAYIYPTVDPATRTVKVRLEFRNTDFQLKPDMFAEVQLNIAYGVQTFVPQEAVLDSGTEQIVFVAHGDGYFEPRQVQIGARVGDRLIVLSGLKPGETIVTSGNFLIDSESRLKSAMGGMQH